MIEWIAQLFGNRAARRHASRCLGKMKADGAEASALVRLGVGPRR